MSHHLHVADVENVVTKSSTVVQQIHQPNIWHISQLFFWVLNIVNTGDSTTNIFKLNWTCPQQKCKQTMN